MATTNLRLRGRIRVIVMNSSIRWFLRQGSVSSTLLILSLASCGVSCSAAETESFATLAAQYAKETHPLLQKFCLDCHSTEKKEGELDLQRFGTLDDVRRSPQSWQKVAEMLDNGEMPPKDAPQPASEQRKQLRGWVERYLNAEAHAAAGDPGPVVLRRLSNAEYTYTIRDLTRVNLRPASEFPADGAAGEGFTNAGNALVMSPALLTKYFDAGKEIARHAVLLPDGIRFSAGTTSRDWTDEILAQIKAVYTEFADGAGKLPLDKYLAATLEEQQTLATGDAGVEQVAARRGLNAKYLGSLWKLLHSEQPSIVLQTLRARWKDAKPQDAAALAAEVARWQQSLSKFQNVGHMKPWVVTVNPLVSRQELRLKITPPATGDTVTLYFWAGDAGNGSAGDFVVWEQPRLATSGHPDLPLRDVRDFTRELVARRARVFASAAKCLDAAAEMGGTSQAPPVADVAKRHGVEPETLTAWLDYLGIGANATLHLDLFKERINSAANYDFVKGWGTHETPLLLANSSDQHVRVPGNMKPHGVTVHPSPTLQAAVGWRSPISGVIRVAGTVTHAHPECGNGVAWSLELRRGKTRQRLATGTSAGSKAVPVGPVEQLAVQTGDLVSLLIGPRDGNHACDLSDVEFTLATVDAKPQDWNLTRDVSTDVLASNPHADRYGHPDVWHFYTEPVQGGTSGPLIPAGSLLAQWQSEARETEKQKLAQSVQQLLIGGPPADKNHPDAQLYRQLASLGGPLFAGSRVSAPKIGVPPSTATSASPADAKWGLDPTLFGKHPDGSAIDPANLCVQAPSVVEVRLPADLVESSELVVTAALHNPSGAEGSAQAQVLAAKPETGSALRPELPILVKDGSAARKQIEAEFDDFRSWFPAALCYSQIVPVDEAVTLTLFHREDEPLCRLMLDEQRRARLDRLWSDLHYVSRDALTIVDAFAQLMEYATQDSDPRLFEPFRKPINERATAFKQQLIDTQPQHLEAVLKFAELAYRRPLSDKELEELRGLYRQLRAEKLPHEEALRLTLARVFVSPAFLYRLEKAPEGASAAPISNWELASRLSYFLWSSLPDAELRSTAASGKLTEPGTLAAEASRMLRDDRVRRLSTEFACQWLHIYEFDALDEKSERHFPTFVETRGPMYEEAIRFFTDLFQRDGSVLEILDADHTFLNESLAKHYGIPGVTGPEWRRVDGMKQQARGGILGLGATLAKQSGASRTSPILRGNWIAEALLGDKLPRPPKDVPRLPEDETETQGLTVRQLVEKHTSDPRCSSCHIRIDPFGYALEGFDAIGRHREKDLGDRPIDTQVRLQDGTEFNGLDGLRKYLLTTRRDAFLKQFCRKLLGYSLGRGVQLSDAPLLEEMQSRLEQQGYRISVAIDAIVRSRQFREIRGKEMLAGE